MIILGAGMAGLLAAHYFRDMEPEVHEAAPSPIDNHQALLRFRSNAVEQVTGAPLRKVRVMKAIMNEDGSLTDRPSLLHANLYSKKVTGKVSPRSIINLEPVDRWIAGKDFMEKLRRGVNVKYGSRIDYSDFDMRRKECEDASISTIPLHVFDNYFKKHPQQEGFEFHARPITVVKAKLNGLDAHQTIYVPGKMPSASFVSGYSEVYRISLVDDEIIIELIGEFDLNVFQSMALIESATKYILGEKITTANYTVSVQKMGKILPLPTAQRRWLVGKITDDLNIYSLGRFATWRQLIMDDLVGDLKTIRKLIENGRYGRQLQYAGDEDE